MDLIVKPSPKPDLDWWEKERERLLKECLRSPKVKQAFIEECREDPLFWMRYTAWAYDPRKSARSIEEPFIPWEFQEETITHLVASLQRAQVDDLFLENIVIDKARDMGASFCVLYVFQWFWQFHGSSFIIGSRKEEEVDKIGDMDTPFEKLRFNIIRQPSFLLPHGFDVQSKKFSKERLLSTKPPGEGGAQIVGESSNENFGRGGRALAAFCDEFQKWEFDEQSWRSLSGTVKVRIAVGTPDGPFNKFAKLVNPEFCSPGEKPENVTHIRLHWWRHPHRQDGLELRNGVPWSPWLQMKSENNDAETMAKEYLLDYNSSQKGRLFESFNEDIHCDEELAIEPELEILRICDPGKTFAWAWVQADMENRRLLIHHELIMDEAYLDSVMENMENISNTRFEDCEFEMPIGDPQGALRLVASQTDADYVLMQRNWGITVNSAWLSQIKSTQREKQRVTMLQNLMNARDDYNRPCLVINKKYCPRLIEAFKGGYRRKVDKSGQVLDTIDRRHPWADIMDCAGMAAVYKFMITGGGKVKHLTVKKAEKKWKNGSTSITAWAS
jgi:hypothetical protein